MVLFRESRYVMHLFTVILVCWMGSLCDLAFGQVGEALTGSANFPDIGLTCIANLAAFLTFILRFKYWYDYMYRRVEASRISEKCKDINQLKVLTTSKGELQECSVLMLSFQMPISITSMKRFMRHISNLYDVQSLSLQCFPLQSAVEVAVAMCRDTCTENTTGSCGCIVFNTVEDITTMIARGVPGTVKKLSDSQCLIPSLCCLRNGCHGCNQGSLYVENDRLIECNSQVESPAAVCELLDLKSIHKASACICIPLRSGNDDEWTNQLMKILKPKDEEYRGAVIRKSRTNAFSALENYKNGNGECDADEKYKFGSVSMVPDLTITLIILYLTFGLKVDGFSSWLLALTALERFCERLNSDICPHNFLTRSCIKSNASKTNICQVLFFRDTLQTGVRLADLRLYVACICSISWMVLVGLEGGANKWYHTHSMPPSKPRMVVILLGIFIALVMDSSDLKLCMQLGRMRHFRGRNHKKITLIICAIIVVEIIFIIACSAIAGVLGMEFFGRWIYSALQCLVWMKWTIGLLIFQNRPYLPKRKLNWWHDSCGLYITCSAVFLNAILAGVRAEWEFS